MSDASSNADPSRSRPERGSTLIGTANVLRRHLTMAEVRRRRAAGKAPDRAIQGALGAALRDWFGAAMQLGDVCVESLDRTAPPFNVGAAIVFEAGAALEAFILMCPELVRRAANARIGAVSGDETDPLTRLDAWLALPLARAVLQNLQAVARADARETMPPFEGAVGDCATDPRFDAAEIFVLTISAGGELAPMRLAIAAPAIVRVLSSGVSPGLSATPAHAEAGLGLPFLEEWIAVSAAIRAGDARLGDVARLRVGDTVRLAGADAGNVRLHPDEAPEAAISIGEIGALRGRVGFRVRMMGAGASATDLATDRTIGRDLAPNDAPMLSGG